MAYVAYFLLLVSSVLLGWAVRNALLEALNRFARYQQEVRLQQLGDTSVSGGGSASLKGKSIPFQTVLAFLENHIGPFLHQDYLQNYLSYLARQLLRMSRRDFRPAQILAYQILLSLGLAFVFGFLSRSFMLAAIAFIMGGGLPLLWLRDQALRRERMLLRELPNALEILSLCSEAGLSLEQSMDQYLKNAKAGPLKEEFSGLLEQTRSGSSRKSALESVSSRLDLMDFSLFSTSLIHAERFGTGISQTLRQLSLTMRDKQSQRAEKVVQEMPVKMLLPLILFIMPVTFIIIFGPVLLQFFQP